MNQRSLTPVSSGAALAGLVLAVLFSLAAPRPAHALGQLGIGAGYTRGLVQEPGNSADIRVSFDVYLVAVGFGVETRLRPAFASSGSRSHWMTYGNFRLVSPGPFRVFFLLGAGTGLHWGEGQGGTHLFGLREAVGLELMLGKLGLALMVEANETIPVGEDTWQIDLSASLQLKIKLF